MTTTGFNYAKQGNVASWFYKRDDLAQVPQFLGLFGWSIIDSLNVNLGDVSAIVDKDPTQADSFIIADVSRSAPDLSEVSINERIDVASKGAIERIRESKCAYVLIIKIDCARPDTYNSWESVFVVDSAYMTAIDFGQISSREEGVPIEVTGSLSHIDARRMFRAVLTERASATIIANVVDVIYSGAKSCGNCGRASEGCDNIYILSDSQTGSPGLSASITWTEDKFATVNNVDIAALGGSNANAIAGVGTKLVVVSQAANTILYIEKNAITSSGWTANAVGLVSANWPLCIASKNAAYTVVGAENGYIYLYEDITASATVLTDGSVSSNDVNDIKLYGSTILGGCASNELLLSNDRGTSWTLITGPSAEAGNNINAVHIVNDDAWYVLYDSGNLYYTMDGGTNWTERVYDATMTTGYDIAFALDFSQHGVLVADDGTSAYVFRTFDGGRRWYRSAPSITNLASAPATYRSVAMCGAEDFVVGGEKTAAGDGVVANFAGAT